MKKANYSLILILVLIITNCTNNKEQRDSVNTVDNTKEDYLSKHLSISVNIEDTLLLGKEYRGELKFLNLLQDSIKTISKDERFSIVHANIFSHKTNINEIKKVECDTFYEFSKNLKDTLVTPFYVTPKKIGSQYVGFIIDEEVYLNAYKYEDTTKTRVLLNSYRFNKNIYVKDTITKNIKQAIKVERG